MPARPAVDTRAVAAAASGCAGVAALAPGPLGIRVGDDAVEVHVIVHYGPPLTPLAARIRAAVEPLLHGRSLTISIDDLAFPDDPAFPGDGPHLGGPP